MIGGLATILEAPRFAVTGPWERFGEIDRGSYDHAPAPDEAIAWAARIATEMTGQQLRVIEATALRFVPGDYLLAHHDPIRDTDVVEVMIDVSAAIVPNAGVHYRRRGAVYFALPSQPGTAAIVERGPSVTSNHTYLSKRLVDASVVRVRVLLASPSTI